MMTMTATWDRIQMIADKLGVKLMAPRELLAWAIVRVKKWWASR